MAARRVTAKVPLPGDAVHLGQILHEYRVVKSEITGFRIPAHPHPIVRVMIDRKPSTDRVERELLATRIVRCGFNAGQLVMRGRAQPEEQIIKLANSLKISPALAEDLLGVYVQT